MKLLESVEELKSWEDYRRYTKESLKLVDGEAPAFISKDKIEFQIDGKPWKGHAFLAGEKAIISVRKFKKGGVIFREGTCTRQGKDLSVEGFTMAKLVKEAGKTFLKLKLGYKILPPEEEGAGGEEGAGSDAERAAWEKIKAQLGPKIKQVPGQDPNRNRIVEIVREATGMEKAADYAGATSLFEELQELLESGGSGLTPERRQEILEDLGKMERDIDRLMAALK